MYYSVEIQRALVRHGATFTPRCHWDGRCDERANNEVRNPDHQLVGRYCTTHAVLTVNRLNQSLVGGT